MSDNERGDGICNICDRIARQVWRHTPEQRVAVSTLRRYSFGLRLTIAQADAGPSRPYSPDRLPRGAKTKHAGGPPGMVQRLGSRQDIIQCLGSPTGSRASCPFKRPSRPRIVQANCRHSTSFEHQTIAAEGGWPMLSVQCRMCTIK